MKKMSFVLAGALMLPLSMDAQTRVEVNAGYGSQSIYTAVTGMLTTIFTAGHASYDSNGTLNADILLYSKNEKFRYGLGTTYEFMKTDNLISDHSNMSFMPKFDYFWSPAEKSGRFYSGAGVGVGITSGKEDDGSGGTTKETATYVAFNVTPIGFRYGKDFGVFLETNVGTKGFVQGGISYIFH